MFPQFSADKLWLDLLGSDPGRSSEVGEEWGPVEQKHVLRTYTVLLKGRSWALTAL